MIWDMDGESLDSGVWKVQIAPLPGTNSSIAPVQTFAGEDVFFTNIGVGLTHGNSTQERHDRKRSFIPWHRVLLIWEVEK